MINILRKLSLNSFLHPFFFHFCKLTPIYYTIRQKKKVKLIVLKRKCICRTIRLKIFIDFLFLIFNSFTPIFNTTRRSSRLMTTAVTKAHILINFHGHKDIGKYFFLSK